jgi:hypothetical protein
MVNLLEHRPGYSLVNKLYSLQTELPAQNWLARAFGASPLTPETRSWYIGLQGEIQVGKVLKALEKDGYVVLHSVPIGVRGSDIDHVIITPSGVVYTINTKNLQGKRIWSTNRTVLVDGKNQPYIRNSKYEADRVEKKLAYGTSVIPLIVYVGVKSLTVKAHSDVEMLEISTLVKFIRSQEKSRNKESLSSELPVEEMVLSDFWSHSYKDELQEQTARFTWFKNLQRASRRRYVRRSLIQAGGTALVLGSSVYFFTHLYLFGFTDWITN